MRRCLRVHLLATSREPLGIGGEVIYRVPSLSLPAPGDSGPPVPGSCDAVALFADRTRAHGGAVWVDEQSAPLVVSVCRRLDGMPLAIELAAARLRSMSLAELHDRLDQRFGLLTGGSRTSLKRQQTLRATVEWSYSLVNGAEQVLLARLAVFAGGFDLDAAEGVCGFGDIQVPEVAGLLGSLVDKSLVVAEPAGTGLRYRLLETIRLFAAGRLAEAGGEEAAAVAAAHCAHFLAVAEAAEPYLAGPEQGSWPGWTPTRPACGAPPAARPSRGTSRSFVLAALRALHLDLRRRRRRVAAIEEWPALPGGRICPAGRDRTAGCWPRSSSLPPQPWTIASMTSKRGGSSPLPRITHGEAPDRRPLLAHASMVSRRALSRLTIYRETK